MKNILVLGLVLASAFAIADEEIKWSGSVKV